MTATIAFALIGLSAIVQIVYLIRSRETPDPVSHWGLLAAAILLFATTIRRSLLIDYRVGRAFHDE